MIFIEPQKDPILSQLDKEQRIFFGHRVKSDTSLIMFTGKCNFFHNQFNKLPFWLCYHGDKRLDKINQIIPVKYGFESLKYFCRFKNTPVKVYNFNKMCKKEFSIEILNSF